MCVKNESYIKEAASDKAFATLKMLHFQQKLVERDISYDGNGCVTVQQLLGVIEHHQREIEIWTYIAYLIEKDNTL